MYDSNSPYGMSYSYTPQKKRTSPLLIVILVVVVGAFGSGLAWVMIGANEEVPPEEWVLHSSAEGNYSVKMPEQPTQKVQTQVVEGISIRITMHLVENRKRAYAVAYSDYPAEGVAQSDPQEILKGAMQGGVQGMKAKLDRSQPIMLGTHPGMEFWATLDDGGLAHYRIYLVHNRLYQQGIIYAEGFEPNPELFFGSFQLLAER